MIIVMIAMLFILARILGYTVIFVLVMALTPALAVAVAITVPSVPVPTNKHLGILILNSR